MAIEAVGVPGDLRAVHALVRPGGRVANVGVHGKPATLHLEELWIKDVTITTGLVDTCSTPTLLPMLQAGRLDAEPDGHPPLRLRRRCPRPTTCSSDPADTGALKVAVLRS